MLAISSDGRWGYTANIRPGTVSVLDLEGRKLAKLIPVGNWVQRITLSLDGKWAFTSADEKYLAVIDRATNEVVRRVPLPGKGMGAAVTPNGRLLLLTLPNRDAVAVIDLKTFQIVRTIPVDKAPFKIVIPPNGRVAYVSCYLTAGKVSVIDLESWKETASLDVGKLSDGMAWVNETVIQPTPLFHLRNTHEQYVGGHKKKHRLVDTHCVLFRLAVRVEIKQGAEIIKMFVTVGTARWPPASRRK